MTPSESRFSVRCDSATLRAESAAALPEHFGAVFEDSPATRALAALVVNVDGKGPIAWRREAGVERWKRCHAGTLGAVCPRRLPAGRLSVRLGSARGRSLSADRDVSEDPMTAAGALGNRADDGFHLLLKTMNRKVQGNQAIGSAVGAKDHAGSVARERLARRSARGRSAGNRR
jgi:hypothetical protein